MEPQGYAAPGIGTLVSMMLPCVAALIVLVRKASVDKILPQIKVEGKVIQTSLDNEVEERLSEALAAAGSR